MIPFCRRLEEADRVLAAMAEEGLERGEDGLEVYVMCEIPNNVILIDEFAERFDGFSIGSNDLTQLTLGVDRDSEMVAFDFDERDPACSPSCGRRSRAPSATAATPASAARRRSLRGGRHRDLPLPVPIHGGGLPRPRSARGLLKPRCERRWRRDAPPRPTCRSSPAASRWAGG